MLYGKDKVRSICRGILPSTRRDSARYDKTVIKRNVRREVREDLRNIRSYEDALDNDYDEFFDRRHDIDAVVWDRRNGDKLGGFIQWSIRSTEHIEDPEDRYNKIRNTVPDNLIGRHALTHIEYLDEFEHGDPNDIFRRYRRRDPQAAETKRIIRYIEFRDAIVACFVDGGHKALNRFIKQNWRNEPFATHNKGYLSTLGKALNRCAGCHNPRILKGIHEVDAFATDWCNYAIAAENICYGAKWPVAAHFDRKKLIEFLITNGWLKEDFKN